MSTETNNLLPEDERAGKERLLQALDHDKDADAGALFISDEENFDNDAAEGLSQINERKAASLAAQLNMDLHRHLRKKKIKSRLPDQSFVYITVITVLLLILISYIIVRKMHQ